MVRGTAVMTDRPVMLLRGFKRPKRLSQVQVCALAKVRYAAAYDVLADPVASKRLRDAFSPEFVRLVSRAVPLAVYVDLIAMDLINYNEHDRMRLTPVGEDALKQRLLKP